MNNVKKIAVSHEHPSDYLPEDLDWLFGKEVFLNMNSIEYVAPFTYLKTNPFTEMYCIVLRERVLYSLENPLEV